MIRLVFGLYDKVAREYRLPIFAPSAAVVVRDLGDELRQVANSSSPMVHHPSDFCLHELGAWDSETGVFVDLHDEPKLVAELDALVQVPPHVDPNHQVGMP